jgi:hypothetical protein
MCLADHGDEVGAVRFFRGPKVREYLRDEAPSTRTGLPMQTRPTRQIEVDCDAIGFQVAKPFRFDNVSPLEEVAASRSTRRASALRQRAVEDIEIAA